MHHIDGIIFETILSLNYLSPKTSYFQKKTEVLVFKSYEMQAEIV